MTADSAALASTIILLFPMLYFLLASPTFLLRRLDDPIVTWLLRGLFNIPFMLTGVACMLAAIAFALSGRAAVGAGFGMIALFAIGARYWFLRHMDAQIGARDAGDLQAVQRLRRLHWGGMLYNATQFAAVVVSIPHLFGAAIH